MRIGKQERRKLQWITLPSDVRGRGPPCALPDPWCGFLPINAFVIKAREPVLVDTGMGIDSGQFMKL